ncbi:GntR family transcriptional regulator [Candidimonas nitroreducens]|nr:GntR family transcriptional regulator [Candidimonas nitroreducens]
MTQQRLSRQKAPRHTDIHHTLTCELAAGLFPVGGRFPSEGELQQRFGVGRHTVREALKRLADQGYIDRRTKSGTIVLATQASERYVQSIGTIENLLNFGVDTELRLRSFGFIRLRDPDLCKLLELPTDERWLRVSGIRVQREIAAPLCYSEYYLPPAFAIDRDVLKHLEGPIFAAVLKQYSLQLDHVDQEIGAIALTTAAGALLHAPAGSPGLTQVRRYFESSGSLIQTALNLYPAGRYYIRSRIERWD